MGQNRTPSYNKELTDIMQRAQNEVLWMVS